MVGRTLSHRMLDPRHRVTRRTGGNDEGRDAALAGGGVGDGKDERQVGALAGRDELLGAIQDEFVADLPGARRDRGGVRSRARLGQAESAELLAAGEGPQVAFLLLRRAMPQARQTDRRVVDLE